MVDGIDWSNLNGSEERKLINRMLCGCLIFSVIAVVAAGLIVTGRGMTAYAQDPDIGLEEISGAADNSEETDCLIIPLPGGLTESDVNIEADTQNKRVNLLINNVDSDFYYDNPLGGNGEQIEKILYGYENESSSARIVLLTREMYELIADISDGELRLEFMDPADVYDEIIVLNPGHAPGMGTMAYGYDESTVDHELAALLAGKLGDAGYGVYVAEDDAAPELAEQIGADMYISIHCSADTDSRITRGQTIEYVRGDGAGEKLSETIRSCIEAEVNGSAVSVAVYGGQKALPAGRTSLIIKAGYLTNYEEAVMLSDKNYLERLAEGLTKGIEEYLK